MRAAQAVVDGDRVRVADARSGAAASSSTPPPVVWLTTLIERIFGGVSGWLSSPELLVVTGVDAIAARTLSPEISFPKIV